MTDDAPRRGRKPGSDKLSDSTRRALVERLLTDTGPVNLKATALEAEISRPTLMRYIAAEPGLQERLEQRRQTAGQGYVKVVRATKKAAEVASPVKARDPLPKGPAAKMFAKLWTGTAAGFREDVARGDLSSAEHLRHALAQAEVFTGLADGTLDAEVARARFDALTAPPPLHIADPAITAKIQAEEDEAAQKFKAIYGYLPSRRKLDRLLGRPGISYSREEWEMIELQRAFDLDQKLSARATGKPRKSYPSRPTDARGHPLVPRGYMAELQRQQEAKGLTGQAAKDAAISAARAAIAAAPDGVVRWPLNESDAG